MKDEPVTTERIERALRFVAYLVARDEEGEAYLPILERLEAELAYGGDTSCQVIERSDC